ncbi:hypothetical protein TrLO_g3452 [Triparma laevis f. longispina]|uniref:Uncharacterized protein n=1 Tax=Triparma laevis f. longispina TaxID=1714387 RepID=A0A9W7DYV7_9STRA|nr:hypothetical protein TrLO_g3452 [Triparma laevis f. longispina]
MFTTSFNDNADADIYINTGAVTVHETCPEGWFGTPTSSTSLNTNVRIDLGATFSGTAKSFSLGELPDNPSRCSYEYCQGGSYTYLTEQKDNRDNPAKLCVPCPPGRFSSEGDKISANNIPVGVCGLECAAGKYKSGTTCLDCTSGKFSDGTTIGITTCKSCPKGKHNKDVIGDESLVCSVCEAGRYNVFIGATTCTDCPDAHLQKSQCLNCGSGKYSAAASPACTSCTAGKYLFDSMAGNEPSACSTCGPGTYSLISAAECKACPAGTYLVHDATLPINHDNVNDCIVCPRGKYLPDDGQTADEHDEEADCVSCVPGKYIADNGYTASAHDFAEDCLSCGGGTYSNLGVNDDGDGVEGSWGCTPCGTGQLAPAGSDRCSTCPAGFECDSGASPVACDKGKFSSGDSQCQTCPVGHKCPGGTDKIACPAGSYQGLTSSEKCIGCEKGKFQGEDKQPSCLSCPEGYFCPELSSRKFYCGSPALFCGANVDLPTAAPEGSYTTPATYEDDKKRTSEKQCEVGNFCVGGEKTKCKEGSAASSAGSTFCESCAGGKFAEVQGQSSCNDCTPGTYSNVASTACTQCSPGTVSSEDKDFCLNCEAGKYSNDDNTVCVQCPIGHWSGIASSGCEKCGPGTVANAANDYCDNCIAGKYNNTENTECLDCGLGNWSGIAAFSCTQCEASKYAAEKGTKLCDPCPDYQESDKGAYKCRCQPGFVNSTDNYGKLICECPAGKRLSNGVCVLCPTGTWKKEVGNANSCSGCDQTAVRESFSTYAHLELAKDKTMKEIDLPSHFLPNNKTACSCDRQYYFKPGDKNDDDDGDGNSDYYVGNCTRCPVDITTCEEPGLKIETLPLVLGYWRSSGDSDNIVKCYTESACVHTNVTIMFTNGSNVNDQCNAGHHGPICNICDEDYAKSITGRCDICVNGKEVPIEMYYLGGAGAFVMLVISVLTVRRMMDTKNSAAEELTKMRNDKKNWFKKTRTTIKIFTSFYQVTSQFEDTLSVRFPENFENFARAIKGFITLDFIKIAKVGCIMEVNFYHKLVFMTLGPLAVSLALTLIAFVLTLFAKTGEIRFKIIENMSATLLSITYIVFASVSTTVLDTFNCKTYGDDPTEYMVSDQSLSCDTKEHKTFQFYAGGMIFVYPVGIPLLYFGLLWKDRKELSVKAEREKNAALLKTGFLWDEYIDKYWWLEVFDCVRRLSQTGLLIFIFRGKASQVVVAMIISAISVALYINWKPFVKHTDNQLAIISQAAIFFTLFAALLTKVEIDKRDNYDMEMFGYLLIAVNVLVIFLFICQGLVQPWKIFVKKVSRTHIHGGYLRGLPSKPAWEDFWDYFDLLIESNSDDAGWDEMKPRDWHMGKKQGKKWLKSTNAEGFWRCSSGNGPIDQLRVTFPLEAEYADVVKHALRDEAMPKYSFKSEIVMTKNAFKPNSDSSVDEYFLTKTPMFWWNRDFMTRRYVKKNEYSFDVIRKSLTPDQEQRYGLPSKLATRGEITLDGLRIESLSGGERCKVTRLMHVDFSEDFLGEDMTQRLLGPRWLRSFVDEYSLLSKDRDGSMSTVASEASSITNRITKIFDVVKRKTMGGVLGGGAHSIDIEMTDRNSSFNFADNPMAKSKKHARTLMPTVGENVNYDMKSFMEDDSTKESRRHNRRKRLVDNRITTAKKLLQKKAAPKAKGKDMLRSESSMPAKGKGEKPGEWHNLVDPTTGDYYYENEVTGETQWDLPEGIEEVMATVISVYMVSEEDLGGGDWGQLVSDLREEFEEFGNVDSLIVPKKGEEGEGYAYCKYKYCWDAMKAKEKMIEKEYAVNFKGDEWYGSQVLKEKKQRTSLKKANSKLRSSFSENDKVWIEHKCKTGENAGLSFFHQPSTGETIWERPEGEIKVGEDYE